MIKNFIILEITLNSEEYSPKKGRKNLKIKLNNIIHHDFNNKIVINKKILFILKLKPKLVYTNYKFAKKSDKLKDKLNNVLIH